MKTDLKLQSICKMLGVGLMFACPLAVFAQDSDFMNLKHWSSTRGRAQRPPTVSAAKTPDGKSAVEAKVNLKGTTQGLLLTLPEVVDLSDIETITFRFRQNGYAKPGSGSFTVRYDKKNGFRTHFKYGAPDQWVKVTIRLDWEKLQSNVKNETIARPGNAATVQFNLYSHLDKPGESIAVADLKFNKRSTSTAVGPVKAEKYFYRNRPTSGDASGTLLTDGKLKKNEQVAYKEYSDNPDVVFDLGNIKLVQDISVGAVAVPNVNIDAMDIYTSEDGKKFQLAKHIANPTSGGKEASYTIDAKNLNLVSRYIRLVFDRNRIDQVITFGEVAFTGRDANNEDIRKSRLAKYDLGPDMPKVTDKDYLIIKQGNNSFAVCRKNGVVRDVIHNGRKIAERIVRDTELFDGKKSIKVDGFRNVVSAVRKDGSSAVVDYTVPGLKNLKFRMTYKFAADGTLISTFQCTSNITGRRYLFSPLRVLLPQKFRAGGRYETWGSGHYLIHRNADELTTAMPVDACSVMSFEAPQANMTMLHHRIRYNGRFTHIGVGAATSSSSVPKNTVMLPNGWQIGDGIFLLDKPGKKVSVESRLTIARGTLVEAFDAYLNIPEVAAFRGRIKRAPWLRDFRMRVTQGMHGLYGDILEKRITIFNSLIREGDMTCILVDHNWPWGDYPSGGRLISSNGGYMSIEQYLARNEQIRKKNPRVKFLNYTWLSSVSAFSNVYRDHPDWFMNKDASGKIISYFGSAHPNYYRLVGMPESANYILKTIPEFIRATKTDGWYLDGGGSPGCLDLFNMRMDEPDAWQIITEKMRERLQKENPDYHVAFNNPENPMADSGILESHSGALTAHWPDGASWMYKFKLWQRNDPWYAPLYIYWNPRVERAILQYMVGTGLVPSVVDNVPKLVPYLSAQHQSRLIRLVNANVSPNYRFTPGESLELMPLTFGDTGWIFMKSNLDKPQTRTVSFEPEALGLKKDLPVYAWCISMLYPLSKHANRGEPEREDDYRNYRWDSDFIARCIYLGRTAMAKRFEKTFKFNPHELKLWMVTQAPALVYSIDSMRTQLWISNTMGVKLAGSMNDKESSIKVSSTRKSAEIMVMIPKGHKAVSAQVNGKDTPFEPFFAAGTSFALLPVPKGESLVVVKYAPVKSIDGKVSLTVKPQKGKLLVTSGSTGVPADSRITLQILQRNMPIWRGDLTVGKQIVKLPRGTTADTYIMQAIDQSGKILGKTSFRLASGTPATPNIKLDVTMPTVNSKSRLKTPAVYPQRGLEIISEASVASKGCGEVKVNAEKPAVIITTPPVVATPYNTLGGALEIKTKRYLKVRFKGSFHKLNGRSNMDPQRLLNAATASANSFFGLTLDFGTADGYTYRTLASCGYIMPKRSSREPANWGTGKNADMLVNISAFGVSTRPTEELWLDMAVMGAPANWDGRLWLGAFWHNATPARTWQMEILESCDKLPAGVSAAVPWIIRGNAQIKQVSITPVRVNTPPVIDGNGKDAVWKNAPFVENFTVLKHPLTKSTVPTKVRFARDSKNLYILAELASPGNDGFSIRPGLVVEKQDSIEFYFRHTDSERAYVQYIFGALPQCYAQYNSHHRKEGGAGARIRELAQPEFKTAVTSTTMTIEAAIPLAELGNPTGSTTFNIARNSSEKNGSRKYYTLAPGDLFYNLKWYKLVWK